MVTPLSRSSDAFHSVSRVILRRHQSGEWRASSLVDPQKKSPKGPVEGRERRVPVRSTVSTQQHPFFFLFFPHQFPSLLLFLLSSLFYSNSLVSIIIPSFGTLGLFSNWKKKENFSNPSKGKTKRKTHSLLGVYYTSWASASHEKQLPGFLSFFSFKKIFFTGLTRYWTIEHIHPSSILILLKCI
jgi:hypothetical protein